MGSSRCRPRNDRPADGHPHHGEQEDVGAERGHSAVGEEQALHDQHHADRQDRRPGTDEDGGERTPHQVAARAGPDREVQHLRCEDEGGDQPGQWRCPVVELAAGTAQGEPDRGGGDHTGRHRGGGVEEAIGHVHVGGPPLGCRSSERTTDPF